MSNTELTDHQLLAEIKAAVREKDSNRAKAFAAEFSERSLARNKARAANDHA